MAVFFGENHPKAEKSYCKVRRKADTSPIKPLDAANQDAKRSPTMTKQSHNIPSQVRYAGGYALIVGTTALIWSDEQDAEKGRPCEVSCECHNEHDAETAILDLQETLYPQIAL